MISAYYIGFEIWGGIFCAITAIAVFVMRKQDESRAKGLVLLLLSLGFLSVSDAFAQIYRGNVTDFGYYAVRISNFLVFASGYIISVVAASFSFGMVNEARESKGRSTANKDLKVLIIVVCLLSAIGLIMLIASQFYPIFYEFDSNNNYSRLVLSPVQQAVPAVCLLLVLLTCLRDFKLLDKEDKFCIVACTVIPAGSLIYVLFNYGFPGGIIAADLCGIILFLTYEISHNRRAADREMEIARKEAQFQGQRLKMMQNQIRPHFIFNSLLAIKQLCYEEPEKAADALQNFAGFLRTNLEALSSDQSVPFLKELECIKEYVALEQADPASKFSIKYDINYSDFYIPILTVQPMVENAIRHGIAGRGADGLVRLSTDLEGDEIFIRVEDNGWGYVSETKQQAEHRSIGIDNVRERLRYSCEGTLSIANTGNGTVVTITIPRKGKNDEEI